MADKYKELQDEVTALGTAHAKYIRETPGLLEHVEELRQEIDAGNRLIANMQANAEFVVLEAKDKARQVADQAEQLLVAAKQEADRMKEILEKEAIRIARQDAMLIKRSAELDARESSVTEIEKANVAQYTILEAASDTLRVQGSEVEAALKRLNRQSVDNNSEEKMLVARGKDLDLRERAVVENEATVAELNKNAQAKFKRSRASNAYADQRTHIQDSLNMEIQKREAFLDDREKALLKKERALNDREGVIGSR